MYYIVANMADFGIDCKYNSFFECVVQQAQNPTHCLLSPTANSANLLYLYSLSWWFSGKESACSAGGAGSIPRSGRSPRGGSSNPLQYSCLENPMDRGDWQATVHGVAKSQTRLSNWSWVSWWHHIYPVIKPKIRYHLWTLPLSYSS